MPKHLHIDPFNGLAGDMFLAALVHLGAPAETISEALSSVRFPGVNAVALRFVEVESHGVRGLRMEISLDPPPRPSHRHYSEIRDAVAAAPIPDRARGRALGALEAVGRAEASAHGVGLEEVHFHELGGFDSVADFVGVALALDLLDVASISSNPLPIGRGEIRSAHGTLPSPAPATLELLKGLPTVGLDSQIELVTPTGAALARTLVDSFGPTPPMVLEAFAAGFGSRECAGRPNCVRLLSGSTGIEGLRRESLVLLEANLDDVSGEVLATLIETTLEAGALDAWLTPALMKKGRPAHLLSALCRYDAAGSVEEAIFRHSTTLGIRRTWAERASLGRTWDEVQTPWGPVRVKTGWLQGRPVNRAPEFEDCRRAAERSGAPIKEVFAAALGAAALPRGPKTG